MAGEGSGRRVEKLPVWTDWDNVQHPQQHSVDTPLASGSSNLSSSGQKRRKKNTPNPLVPPNEYVKETRAIAVNYYTRRSTHMLLREFVNLNEEGYHKLSLDMHKEIVSKFEASEKFNDWSDYWLHSEWLERQVVALTTNIVAGWSYHTGKKVDQTDLSTEDKELVSKLNLVQRFVQQYSSSRLKKRAPWKATLKDELLAHCVSGTFKWLEPSVKVVAMPEQTAEGSYGTVRKVMLTKLVSISTWIPFAGKTLKTKNEKEKRQLIINEAAGCPVKHPGIIRLAYLHPKTMEGYTLWWNGGSLQSFLVKYNSKVSESLEYDAIEKEEETGLTKDELRWVAIYRKNRVDLALSLLVIVGRCHEANYIHNDITPTNVLLHFDDWKADTVYIGICDWGISSRVVENEPSRYGYRKQEDFEKERSWRKFAAPELFYIFGEEGSTNSLQIMQQKHLYSMAADAYSAGYIAAKIWSEDWNPKYFSARNKEQYENLGLKLRDLQKENPRERASVPDVLDLLRKAPHCWTMPACCFRT